MRLIIILIILYCFLFLLDKRRIPRLFWFWRKHIRRIILKKGIEKDFKYKSSYKKKKYL